ncbi:MAG TPA: DUF4082 domain-containing protein [Candidatus Saccharimonadia bacterium]|nr:DUF4082 domain-containing protein [Candidatus Saccharimonadia bacterium]
MPRVSKSPGRRPSSRRQAASSRRRKSKSLLSQLGAINLFRPLKLSRSQALLAAGFMAVIGIAAVAYSFAASSYSFWSNSAVPNRITADTQATELGLKFNSDSAGTIDAVRFYKAKANTGVHTGSLWTSSGERLATVTFTAETAKGWQTAKFATPVKIAANTTYVVSYHTNVGSYGVDLGYFNTARTKGPLHALLSTNTSPNGVYVHGASAFPTQPGQATNYWVDVVFSPAAISTPTPTATVTPTPITGTTTCPLPAYPSTSCTGRSSSLGSSYTNEVSDYTVTTNDTVIDNWHVKGDLDIKAANVVIRNSQIDGTINNDGYAGTSFTVADSTVGPATCATNGLPSLQGHDFTATRVYLRGHQDGVDMGADNVTVTDSLLQPCFQPASVVGSDGFHSDGVQDQCSATCSNLTLTHNTIDARAIYNGTPTGNSALNLGSGPDGYHMRNVTLNDNLFLGGGYTTDLHWDAGNAWVVKGNAWVKGSWAYDAITTEGTCSNQSWSGNSIVTADTNFNATSTVSSTGCVD